MKYKQMLHVKSLFGFLFSKVVIIGFLIILQVAFLLASVFLLADYSTAVSNVLTILSLLIVIWLVAKDENPSYKLAWVVLILALPIFGGLLYLVLGNKGMPQRLVRRITAADASERNLHLPYTPCCQELAAENQQLATLSAYITNTTNAPPWNRTQAAYFSSGEQMWHVMLEELHKAQRFIFMEYFILSEGIMWDSIFSILKEKAAQGVDVRFMYDDIGCIHTLPGNYAQTLQNAGIKCIVFNPFKPHLNSMMNYRDHRKITVIDGNVGFCGGINIADEYINQYEKYGHWKDTAVMLKGDAVWNFTAMFLALWNFAKETDTEFNRFRPTLHCPSDGFVQPFGDSPLDRINSSEDAYMQIINRATRYVYIATPYLILDNEMVSALQMAARSGVDVRILTPKIPDKWLVHQCTQSFYQALLSAGVRIFEYTAGFVHAKMYACDDKVAVVGTANMDYRSFYLHFECGVCFYLASIVADVRDDILNTIALSSEVPADYNRHVPLWKRMLRSVLRLFCPLM